MLVVWKCFDYLIDLIRDLKQSSAFHETFAFCQMCFFYNILYPYITKPDCEDLSSEMYYLVLYGQRPKNRAVCSTSL